MGKLEALRASCALVLGGNLGRRLLCRRAPGLHKAAAAEQKVQPDVVKHWEVERANVRSHLPCGEGAQKRTVWGSIVPIMGLGGRGEVSLP